MGTQFHSDIIATPPDAAVNPSLFSLKEKPKITKKKLIRRHDHDYSQVLRRGYQFAFLLINVWVGGQFYL